MKRFLLLTIGAALAGFVAGSFFIHARNSVAPAKILALGDGHAADTRRESTAGGRSPEDVLGSALSALFGQNDLRGLAELGATLGELDSAQIATLLDRLSKESSRQMQDRCAWLFSWWSKRDPKAAAAWFRPQLDAATQDGPPYAMMMTARAQKIAAWAKTDRLAALEYARQHLHKGIAIELLRAAMDGWADENAEQHLAVLLAFPEGKARTAGLEMFLRNWAKRDAARAITQYRALGLADSSLLSSLLRTAAESNPVQALEMLAQFDDAQIARSAPALVQQWAGSDPAASLGWALAHGVSVNRRYEETGRVEHNSFRRESWNGFQYFDPFNTALAKQPAATLAWVRSLPGAADRDRLLELVATSAKDFEQTLGLFSELPAEAAIRVANRIGASFQNEPERVQKWAASLPAGPAREEAWQGIGAVTKEELPLPPGPDRDAMLSGMIRTFQNEKATEQALALALKIGDAQLRRDVIDEAMDEAVNLHPDKAEEARAVLEKTTIPDEWKRRWRK